MPKRSLDLVVMPMMLISEIGITIALTLMISPPNHSGLVINPPEKMEAKSIMNSLWLLADLFDL
ncbi:hypothetical protein ABXV23_12305 [Vibrio owensii]|uniref:hypothetical protein n=1 Tax=Vibrio owensii TaxID=696485 RepID=UPI0033962397